MPDEICEHCGYPIRLRNPSGFCDHLCYPDNCEICKKRVMGKTLLGNRDELMKAFREFFLVLEGEGIRIMNIVGKYFKVGRR